MSIKAIKRLLVANRGEIACRIIKTAKALGLETVAVYSKADQGAPHTTMADASVSIGPAPALESYLSIENIIAAAKETRADAIHPGYGFLSENAAFAEACTQAGIVFVGPSAKAIELMGNKAEAKRLMLAAGVPCVPGFHGTDQSDQALEAAAKEIGFPLMVKAAAGGGGRGMRLVPAAEDLPSALASARSEAENAFGSGELILEKAIQNPRHVEIQIFADSHSNIVHMGERDCSVQRRHQKVIEESPCPVMTDDLRASMGAAAVNAAKAVDYVGAGTVEFLLDTDGAFYFLEMNTRLQVEHPVTEMVTGLDLVALQLFVAEGRPLGLKQSDIVLNGHSIEVRLYAEDPAADFLPAAGTIHWWQPPLGVRTDSGIETGQQVSPHYDPMLAKVVAHGDTREQARANLVDALKKTVLFGPKTNLAFLIACMEIPAFVRGEATTGFIAEHFEALCSPASAPDNLEMAIAAVLDHHLRAQSAAAASLGVSNGLMGWASASGLVTPVCYSFGGESFDLFVRALGADQCVVECGEFSSLITVDEICEGTAQLRIDGEKIPVAFYRDNDGKLHTAADGRPHCFINQIYAAATSTAAAQSGQVVAPMHGMLIALKTEEGAAVKAGECLAVLEAMKMQHQITAGVSGTVEAVNVSVGEQIAADQVLFEIAEEAEGKI